MGKSTINGSCPIAMLNYQRVGSNDLMNNHCEALIAHPCSSSFEDASQFPDAKSRQQCLQAMACDPAPKAKSNHVPSLTHIYP